MSQRTIKDLEQNQERKTTWGLSVRVEALRVHPTDRERPLFEVQKFQLEAGGHLLIEGPSGIGKTTFLHILAGLATPQAGRCYLGEFEVTAMSDRERTLLRRKKVGVLFQRLNLLEPLTALENVMLSHFPKIEMNGAEAGDRNDGPALSRVRALSCLAQVGLEAFSNRRIASLSLGEQQRVAVARILFQSPQIILADEPTSSLDDANTEKIADVLLELARDRTLIVVSHDERLKKRFSQVLYFQDLVGPGSESEVSNSSSIQQDAFRARTRS